mgnify:CR=1 FL=1
MKYVSIILTSIIFLGFSNLSLATISNVVDCSTRTNTVDYGNATNQGSSACHDTPYWQRLGSTWNSDNPATSETNLSTNDGVSWVTSSDGGSTWVDNGELTSGGLVKFQFDVTRATTGNHKYDLLKSWVDWNQDGVWTEDETIITETWWKNESSEGVVATSGNVNNDLSTWSDLGTPQGLGSQNSTGNSWSNGAWVNDIYNSADTTATYFSDIIAIPVLDTLAEIWLRARVVCENSLSKYADNMNLISIGYQDQGEVEDYRLTVANKPVPVVVPEPSTLFIFALGLLTLATRRKMLNK